MLSGPQPETRNSSAQQHLEMLLEEMSRLCRNDKNLSSRQFLGKFLSTLAESLTADAAGIWTLGPDGAELVYQYRLAQTGLLWPQNRSQLAEHHQVVTSAIHANQSGQSTFKIATTDEQSESPSDYQLLFCPLRLDSQTVTTVELFLDLSRPSEVIQASLELLQKTCRMASEFFRAQEKSQFSDRQTLWNQLERFSRDVHESLEPQKTSYAIANEGRLLIGCDRLTVAVNTNRRFRVLAVSGEDCVVARAPMIKSLELLISAVATAGGVLSYAGGSLDDLEPQIEQSLREYLDQSNTRSIALLPLRVDKEEGVISDDAPIGMLVVEQFSQEREQPGMAQRIEVVQNHSSLALQNAMEVHKIPFRPLWMWFAKIHLPDFLRNRRGRQLLAACAIGIFGCLLIPVDLTVHAEGELLPTSSHIFAGVDGQVVQVLVRHGEFVNKGTLLLRLRNDELEAEIVALQGKLASTIGQIDTYRRARGIHRDAQQSREEVVAALRRLQTEATFLREAMELKRRDQKLLSVTAPADGVVLTWDTESRLQRRPVSRGQLLLDIGMPNSTWKLDLQVPETLIGHVEQQEESGKHRTKVEYVMGTDPTDVRWGLISEIEHTTELSDTASGFVRTIVEISPDQIPENARPGSTVTAKIHCGSRSWGYVLSYQWIDHLRRIWFRW